ncbi:hypothetical protein MSAN_01215800 [Mycena sanguinolenta]|uniref:Uncharacterized protein n=1 Tax=Mycena sanguinolenta TaxID=230812 RepID=A0A8H7D4S1_9AGAR|nr:hypothetical protein MSAN_01215800 [Mycena sanguinolenta]
MVQIPNVMLTVMGVVIGFVISYRPMSGYDRYWMGRTAWTVLIRNARTMSRLIWCHVLPRHYARSQPESYHTRNGEVPALTAAVSTPSAPPTASTSAATASVSGVSTTSANSTLKPTATATHAAKRPTSANYVSQDPIHQPLLPASDPAPARPHMVLNKVSPDIIPFAGVAAKCGGVGAGLLEAGEDCRTHHGTDRTPRMRTWSGPIHPLGVAQLEEFEIGENLPEEVLRCLSEWVSVLEERGTVPGTSLGAILGGIQQFEMSLTTLEHILTTPLPFVYSVHIRVVWLYLFLLPLQLVNEFGWHTVPAVCVGAFIYLGFLAAGEEIEQPFGYDDNDLDLDMFCRDIIRQDIRCLKRRPASTRGSRLGPSSPTPLPPTVGPKQTALLARPMRAPLPAGCTSTEGTCTARRLRACQIRHR